jgi:epoxyqueuosine reductase
MGNYHSTLSRRDFLKALGLGGAGLGASAAFPMLSTPLRDLDEAVSSPMASFKHPSWVKSMDKPTADIDWPTLKRFDYHYERRRLALLNWRPRPPKS